ncbi:hypothetical protein VP01_3222g1 [Puccinia sorghi]|uniref:Uncharacterized protein n=1 Tax=Puccinia sorghi TaxID=27349 RepID=A0A0L6UYC5_9BASI|nr:hypothetical protein VP01_3222g1 [Puccinia sorghi]
MKCMHFTEAPEIGKKGNKKNTHFNSINSNGLIIIAEIWGFNQKLLYLYSTVQEKWGLLACRRSHGYLATDVWMFLCISNLINIASLISRMDFMSGEYKISQLCKQIHVSGALNEIRILDLSPIFKQDISGTVKGNQAIGAETWQYKLHRPNMQLFFMEAYLVISLSPQEPYGICSVAPCYIRCVLLLRISNLEILIHFCGIWLAPHCVGWVHLFYNPFWMKCRHPELKLHENMAWSPRAHVAKYSGNQQPIRRLQSSKHICLQIKTLASTVTCLNFLRCEQTLFLMNVLATWPSGLRRRLKEFACSGTGVFGGLRAWVRIPLSSYFFSIYAVTSGRFDAGLMSSCVIIDLTLLWATVQPSNGGGGFTINTLFAMIKRKKGNTVIEMILPHGQSGDFSSFAKAQLINEWVFWFSFKQREAGEVARLVNIGLDCYA